MKNADDEMLYKTLFSEYPDLLTIPQVKTILQVDKHLVYKLINTGVLKSFKIGNSHRVPKFYLIEYVLNGVKKPSQK